MPYYPTQGIAFSPQAIQNFTPTPVPDVSTAPGTTPTPPAAQAGPTLFQQILNEVSNAVGPQLAQGRAPFLPGMQRLRQRGGVNPMIFEPITTETLASVLTGLPGQGPTSLGQSTFWRNTLLQALANLGFGSS